MAAGIENRQQQVKFDREKHMRGTGALRKYVINDSTERTQGYRSPSEFINGGRMYRIPEAVAYILHVASTADAGRFFQEATLSNQSFVISLLLSLSNWQKVPQDIAQKYAHLRKAEAVVEQE